MRNLILPILALLLSVNLTYAAWELPTATPPNGNPDVPVNTGTVAQTKLGDLTVTTNINTNSIWTNLFRLTTGAGAGKVLQSNANGDATWVATSTLGLGGGGGTDYWSRIGTVLSPTTAGDKLGLGDGTATAPTYSFTSTPTAGMFRPTTNSLGFSTLSSERIRINSSGNVGIGTVSPNSAAILDVVSTTKGFLPPRMTTAQRDAITLPPAGLVIFNTTTNQHEGRTSSAWVPLGGAGGGGGAGSGTTDYLAKWATGTTLGNSQIFDNGTNVGVGTATAAAKLQVQAVSGRQFTTTNGWVDLSSTSNGNGMVASNAYLDQSDGLFKYSNSSSIGVTGFIMNYPAWDKASIFVNNGPSTAGLSFAPSRVITFSPNATEISGTLDISGNTNISAGRLDVSGAIGAGGRVRAGDGLTTTDIYLTTLAGSGSATNICRASATGFLGSCSSSIRYKDNILPFSYGLKTLSKLKPVTFDWRSTRERDIGLIAEEVEKISPLFTTYNKDGEVEGVKYSQLSVLAIAAIKEQQEQIESLKKIVCQDHSNEAVCR